MDVTKTGIRQLQVGIIISFTVRVKFVGTPVVSNSICRPTGTLLDCMANLCTNIHVAADVIPPYDLFAYFASCIQ